MGFNGSLLESPLSFQVEVIEINGSVAETPENQQAEDYDTKL
jgi:hypothetical protein